MSFVVKTVACIGAGNVGRAWAIVFARAGLTVKLFDAGERVINEQAMPAIKQSLRDLKLAELVSEVDNVLERIQPASSIAAALEGAQYVQESVKEDVHVKRQVFEQLGKASNPKTILASSTSAIPGSKFMDAAVFPERCIIAHPVNPPYLIPLVEVCASPLTSTQTKDRCVSFMQNLGQEPIVVNKEVPGFILNRLQFTLVAEALHLVGEGYCSAEDVDKVLKHGLALRWSFIGPFEVAHLNASEGFLGFVDNLGAMMRSLAKDANVDYEWGPELASEIHQALIAKTPVDELPQRQAWRDRRIMALRQHLDRAKAELG